MLFQRIAILMRKPLIVHPFLIAIWPVAFLFSHNVAIATFSETIIPMVIILGFTVLLLLVLKNIFKSYQKAGVIVSLGVILFFSYGHILSLIWPIGAEHHIGEKQRYWRLSSGMCILYIFVIFWVAKTRRDLSNLTKFLNIAAIFLVLMPMINIGIHVLKPRFFIRNENKTDIEEKLMEYKKPVKLPNIYYIIMDGYGRKDVLREIHGYDNSKFINYLIHKGFFVASESRSNYVHTQQSLASSMNLKYINYLKDQMGIESKSRRPLDNMIANNHVFNFLRKNGYKLAVFSSWHITQITSADICIRGIWKLNDFQNLLINVTPIAPLLRLKQYVSHRNQIIYILDNIADIEELGKPWLVFAHILAPHPPFVFGPNGEKVQPDRPFFLGDGSLYRGTALEYLKNYKKQLEFINKKLMKTIDSILSKSDKPPIIILQGDHGSRILLDWGSADNTYFKESFSILNAYYFPDKDYGNLYETVTPVNSFRIIFNEYFNTNHEILEDRSYFATWDRPYKFLDVTHILDANPEEEKEKLNSKMESIY